MLCSREKGIGRLLLYPEGHIKSGQSIYLEVLLYVYMGNDLATFV